MKKHLLLIFLGFLSFGLVADDEMDCLNLIDDTEKYIECVDLFLKYEVEDDKYEVENEKPKYVVTNNLDCTYGSRGVLKIRKAGCPLFEKDYKPSKANERRSINLICKLQKTNTKKSSDVVDRYGRKIGSIEDDDDEKYSLSIVIDGEDAQMKFDERLLPELNTGTSVSGEVKTSEGEYKILYKPNFGNDSTITINRYSGFIKIDSQIFDGIGNTIKNLIDAYEGRSSKKKQIIGECEGGKERKF